MKGNAWRPPRDYRSDPFGRQAVMGKEMRTFSGLRCSWFPLQNRRESAKVCLPWAYQSDWYTLWVEDLDIWQQWDGFYPRHWQECNSVKSPEHFRKCNVPHESFSHGWYFLGLSPGWMNQCTRFTCWLLVPSQRVLTELFSGMTPIWLNKEMARFPHS